MDGLVWSSNVTIVNGSVGRPRVSQHPERVQLVALLSPTHQHDADYAKE
jgi:hypothetical protein